MKLAVAEKHIQSIPLPRNRGPRRDRRREGTGHPSLFRWSAHRSHSQNAGSRRSRASSASAQRRNAVLIGEDSERSTALIRRSATRRMEDHMSALPCFQGALPAPIKCALSRSFEKQYGHLACSKHLRSDRTHH